MIKICKYCKKEFKGRIKQKLCSRKCADLYKHKDNIIKKCLKCGKEFEVSKNDKRKYCSNRCCKSNKKGIHIEIRCLICGKIFEIPFCRVDGKSIFCSKSCVCIWRNKNMKKKDTYIELKIENELKKKNIKYNKQSSVLGITLADFVLNNKIIIQCDGDYWHSFKKVKNRDINQDIILGFNGYKVFRFTETEINKSSKKCINKVEKYIKNC